MLVSCAKSRLNSILFHERKLKVFCRLHISNFPKGHFTKLIISRTICNRFVWPLKSSGSTMVDVIDSNFEEVLPKFEHQIKKCSFVAIDCEFTSLPIRETVNSFQDSGSDRYLKIRQSIDQCFSLQVGLVPFTFDRDLAEYEATVFRFTIFPKFFGPFDNVFTFRTSSIQFLRTYNFDFNKVFYDGIPFLNQSQTKHVKELIDKRTLLDEVNKIMTFDEKELVASHYDTISKWLHHKHRSEDVLTINVGKKSPHVNYFIHKEIRRCFKAVWSFQDGINSPEITVKRVSEEERNELMKTDLSIDLELLTYLRGFSRVIDVLAQHKKPIVGHNMILDLLSCSHFYHDPLPDDYQKFKTNLNKLFPVIYDTKFISHEIKRIQKFRDSLDNISLQNLFMTFRDAEGHKVKLESGLYEASGDGQQLHDAGWDAYITGYCFLKMMHLLCSDGKKSNKFLSNAELMATASQFKNKTNIVRSAIPYLQLDGPDPTSTRPPALIVTHSTRLDPNYIDLVLAGCGTFEIRPISACRATIAVGNYSTYQDVIGKFHKLQGYRLEKYSPFKHNIWVRSLCLAGLLTPASLTAWYFLHK